MSWDVDEKEFYETFAEITEDRGIEEAKRWAWSALHWAQQENRESEKKIEELLKHRESCADNLLKGYETGKTEERAAVVAYLREEAYLKLYEATPEDVSDHIERGEHSNEERD
jgi:hypothetical protein